MVGKNTAILAILTEINDENLMKNGKLSKYSKPQQKWIFIAKDTKIR